MPSHPGQEIVAAGNDEVGDLDGFGEGVLGEDEGFDEMIDLDRVEGRVKASSVKKVGEIVSKHPEEAVAILRNWMYQQDQ